MPRIIGIDIPNDKKIGIALRYLYGIGPTRSLAVLEKAGISPDVRAKDLTEAERSKITSILQSEYTLEGDLRREIAANIKRLMSIGSYRGSRHKRGLPVRGQRTHTNARTRKGPRKVVGATKRAESKRAE